MTADPYADPYADLADFTALPRVTGLALSRDGRRLVASVQEPDAKGARYVSALWEVPLDGGEPARLTRSEKGESAPVFRPDGSLLFVSARPGPDADDEDPALWVLPATGEPRVLARHPGGLSGPVVAAEAGTVVASGSRLAFSGPEDDDAERRKTRSDRKISAILNTGMPIRFWDAELGAESPRLLAVDDDAPRDLTPDAGMELNDADCTISADGRTVAATWWTRRPRGAVRPEVVLVDVASGDRRVLAGGDDREHEQPRIAPDGSRVALMSSTIGAYDRPVRRQLRIVGADGTDLDGTDLGGTDLDLGDLWPSDWVWSADSRTLFVTGDLHGRGAIVAVDADGTRTLVDDAVYTSLRPSPHGTALYALRTTVDTPPTPVRLDPATGERETLPSPAAVPAPRGRLVEVERDGVRGWLCLPEGGGAAPLMVWIHGGPFASFNSWSWRWNPWVAVARGWAVLMPDPALSTGYGPGWIDRAWPHRAGPVWADVETLLDAVAGRPDVDGDRTACLGASFGGYMTNWVAGHTDRFGAIVTHSGTWALDQKNATADVAFVWDDYFGRPGEHPDWFAENSPHLSAGEIRTPMLVLHGNRDYRVPVGEAVRLWWDLVSRWDGDPADLPHRFLNFPGENHWILSPANAEIWWDAVLGFCGQHVLGEPWTPTPLL